MREKPFTEVLMGALLRRGWVGVMGIELAESFEGKGSCGQRIQPHLLGATGVLLWVFLVTQIAQVLLTPQSAIAGASCLDATSVPIGKHKIDPAYGMKIGSFQVIPAKGNVLEVKEEIFQDSEAFRGIVTDMGLIVMSENVMSTFTFEYATYETGRLRINAVESSMQFVESLDFGTTGPEKTRRYGAIHYPKGFLAIYVYKPGKPRGDGAKLISGLVGKICPIGDPLGQNVLELSKLRTITSQ